MSVSAVQRGGKSPFLLRMTADLLLSWTTTANLSS